MSSYGLDSRLGWKTDIWCGGGGLRDLQPVGSPTPNPIKPHPYQTQYIGPEVCSNFFTFTLSRETLEQNGRSGYFVVQFYHQLSNGLSIYSTIHFNFSRSFLSLKGQCHEIFVGSRFCLWTIWARYSYTEVFLHILGGVKYVVYNFSKAFSQLKETVL